MIALVAEGGVGVMLDEGALAVGHNGCGAEVIGVVIVEDGIIRLAVGVGLLREAGDDNQPLIIEFLKSMCIYRNRIT